MASRKPKTTEVKERKVGFINESLDDIKEAAPAPEGEYDLRITKANRKESKKGTDMIECVIVFEDGDVDAPPIFHYLLSWDENTSEEEIIRRKRGIKRFCAVFDVDPSDFDETDLKGQTGTCPVVQEEGDDGEVRNRLKLPRIKE
jgi:hypothetical protein